MGYDVILVTGEYHADHPLSPTGVIAKVLESNGFSVGIIEKPNWAGDDDFLKLGAPRLFFGVTSGSMDSMLANYTPLKKLRKEDKYEPYDSKMPDRAVLAYCNKLKQLFKGTKIVIGGIEASMRRFAHYDYWDNKVRRSIMLDSRADILVYGNGEYQITEIAKRIRDGKGIGGIEGTCTISKEVPEGFEMLPSYEEVLETKKNFCRMQAMFSNEKNLAQKSNERFVLQNKMHNYTTEELDHIYGLDYSRNIPKHFPEFKAMQFSIVTHRGCIGKCSFCSIPLHQGARIISRSEDSILSEAKKIAMYRDFKGIIDDLGGPSANMYGMDCSKCKNNCISCKSLDRSHRKLISLMRKIRTIPGIKKVFVRSGIRYDLAMESEEYVKELSLHHISGCLKIAPEHFSGNVLDLMNKNYGNIERFRHMFGKHNLKSGQKLKIYLMTGHPGSGLKEADELAEGMKPDEEHSIQLFTPTPMTVSTCMYHTGLNPYNLKEVHVPYTYSEKKLQKRAVLCRGKKGAAPKWRRR